MFAFNKKLLIGFAILAIGEIGFKNPSYADPDGGIIRVNNTPAAQSSVNSGGDFGGGSETFNAEGVGSGGGVTIPADVLQLIGNIDGVTNVSGGVTGGEGVTQGDATSGGDPLSGDTSALGTESSETVTICFTDPCTPSGESTKAITLDELARLIEEDLQQSLSDVAAAEALEQELQDRPRKFVRRRSTSCISPTIQARETYSRKLEQSRQFLEQLEQLNPNNSIW